MPAEWSDENGGSHRTWARLRLIPGWARRRGQSMSVRLRRTTADDLDFILAAEHDEENLPFIGQWSREQHMGALREEDIAHMTVERVEHGGRVGYVILTDLGRGLSRGRG